MDSRYKAIHFLSNKQFSNWKLYKGTNTNSANRVAQYESEEDDYVTAIQAFRSDIENRMPGNYRVVSYRKPNGSQAGDAFDFTIENNNSPMFGQQQFDPSQIYERARKDLENEARQVRIEEKLDAIAEMLKAILTEEKEDDFEAVEKFGKLFSMFKGAGSSSVQDAISRPLSTGVNKGLFS